MLLEKSREITPEGTKGLSQSENNAQLWTWLVMEVKSDAVKIYVRSMNHGKLEVVKQDMTRVNIDLLEISELKCTWVGEFNADDHYVGKNSFAEME